MTGGSVARGWHQAVTTVWGTKLGTRLLNGFNSTTDDTAYFALLVASHSMPVVEHAAKFLPGMVPPTRALCF